MKRMWLGVAVATTMAVVAVPAAVAQQGSDPNASATFLGTIHPKGKKATLRVKYQCAEGEAVWVSAKQTKSGRKSSRLTKEGSSKVAASWLESHRNPFTCDGAPHTATFSIDTVEKGSKGRLRKGQAWVQFCVTKGQEDLILSKSAWVDVSG
jgi:hypothetical protein